MVNGASPGPRPSGPGPGQQLAAHLVQLADVAPPEAAQENAQSLPPAKAGGGRRLDHAAQHPPGAAGGGKRPVGSGTLY